MSERKGNLGRGKSKIKPLSSLNEGSVHQGMAFEERISAIACPEFHIVENDFPSLLNCEEIQTTPVNLGKTNENTSPQTLSISYSAKLLSKNVQPIAIGTGLQNNTNEIENSGETSPVLIKKKRKRRKKKPKRVVSGNSLDNTQSVMRNIQIDLEDPEEYPVLGASSTMTKAKPIGNEIPTKIPVSKEVSTPTVPGLLKINTSSLKMPTKTTRIKANTPVQINIFDVLTKPHKQAEVKAKKTITPATFNVRKAKVNITSKSTPHNVLDSSAPLRKRGKEREKPKAKVTKLKKVILQERLLKKQRQTISEPVETEGVSQVIEKMQNVDIRIEDVQVNELRIEDEIVLKDLETLVGVKNENVSHSSNLHNEGNIDDNIFAISEFEAKTDDFDQTMACVKKIIHTRKYRDYCNQQLSEEIDSTLESLLTDLVRFQDRQFQKDPIKAKIRKRMVFGLKEVVKNIKLGKVKVVIIAPDVEQISSQGGLNDTICNLIKLCEDNKILTVFGLPRRKLGYVCKKAVPVSCIGIISYEGKEDLFKKLAEFVTEARTSYQFLVGQIEKQLNKEMTMFILNSDPNNKQLQDMKKTILLQASQSC